MIGLGSVGTVNQAAAGIANRGRAMEAVVKSQLAIVSAVGVDGEEIPVFGMIRAINDAAVWREGQTVRAIESSGGDLAKAIGVGGRTGPYFGGLVQLHCSDGVTVGGWGDRQVLAEIMRNSPDCTAGIIDNPQLTGRAGFRQGGEQKAAAIGQPGKIPNIPPVAPGDRAHFSGSHINLL